MAGTSKGGQPPALTARVQEIALKRCREGVPVEAIAGELEVARSTIYHWLELGEAESPPPDHALFVAFAKQWRKAEAADIRASLAKVRATAKGHRGNQFHLERRYPKIFGSRAAIELTGKDGKPIEHKHDVHVDRTILAAEIEAFAARYAGGAGPGDPGGVAGAGEPGATPGPRDGDGGPQG